MVNELPVNIIQILENEGVKFEGDFEKEETARDLAECIARGNFRFIIRDGKHIGFLTWHEVVKDNKLHIFVNNLIIYKDFRNKNSLLNVRSFFKEKYPNRCWGFWHNRKKNRFFYERRNK